MINSRKFGQEVEFSVEDRNVWSVHFVNGKYIKIDVRILYIHQSVRCICNTINHYLGGGLEDIVKHCAFRNHGFSVKLGKKTIKSYLFMNQLCNLFDRHDRT